MNMNQYDSSVDTLLHIKRVNELLIGATSDLLQRGVVHDQSKLESVEKLGFDVYSSALKASTYGSEEYQTFLVNLAPFLAHHYKMNSHHPEHYEQGIDGMNLFDVLEMFCDWKAASERHDNGNIYNSITVNAKRFKMSDQLVNIFNNTAKYLKYKR